MNRILFSLFVLFFLLKVEWLGINGAGALTVAQLIFIGFMDEWSSRRADKKFPYNVTRDKNGVIQWTARVSTSKTTDFNTEAK